MTKPQQNDNVQKIYVVPKNRQLNDIHLIVHLCLVKNNRKHHPIFVARYMSKLHN